MARNLTREEGLFVGGSAGLIAHAALTVARRIDDPDALRGDVPVRYGRALPVKVFNDEWMRENQMLDAPSTALSVVLGNKSGTAPLMSASVPA